MFPLHHADHNHRTALVALDEFWVVFVLAGNVPSLGFSVAIGRRSLVTTRRQTFPLSHPSSNGEACWVFNSLAQPGALYVRGILWHHRKVVVMMQKPSRFQQYWLSLVVSCLLASQQSSSLSIKEEAGEIPTTMLSSFLGRSTEFHSPWLLCR